MYVCPAKLVIMFLHPAGTGQPELRDRFTIGAVYLTIYFRGNV